MQRRSSLGIERDHDGVGVVIGKVHRVLDNAREHIFDGIEIATPGGRRFVDAPEVARITEQRVTLTIDAAEAANLPVAQGMGAAPQTQAKQSWWRRMFG